MTEDESEALEDIRGEGYHELPEALQDAAVDYLDRGFEVVMLSDGEGRYGILADRDDTRIQITDFEQTWFVTLLDDDRPNVEDCWCHPARVADVVERWLDETGDGDQS